MSLERDRQAGDYIRWARGVRAEAERASRTRRHERARDFIAWEAELHTIELPPRDAPSAEVPALPDAADDDHELSAARAIEAVVAAVVSLWLGLIAYAVIMYVRMAP